MAAIIYQGGDNFRPNGSFTVLTPPTTLDTTGWSNTGPAVANIIAFGQDLASLTGGSSTSVALLRHARRATSRTA